jgi:hypothetical protein
MERANEKKEHYQKRIHTRKGKTEINKGNKQSTQEEKHDHVTLPDTNCSSK